MLYVAMTRASSWLIVAGTEPLRGQGDDRWHGQIADGLRRAGAVELPFGDGETRLRLEAGGWPTGREDEAGDESNTSVSVPDALHQNVAYPTSGKSAVSPSDLGGDKVVASDAIGGESNDALQRGTDIHRLLEVLPSLDREDWERAATNLLPHVDDPAPLLEEAATCISDLPDIFVADALLEVDVSAFLPTIDRQTFGAIDRLIVSDTKITAIDYKSNAVVPDSPADTPEGLLRQMGAYLEALEQIYPSREIEVAIVWTATAQFMPLPHGIVREALARATTS